MNIVRFQGENQNIYYEFDKDSTPLGEGGMGRVYQGFMPFFSRATSAFSNASIIPRIRKNSG